MQAPIKTTLSVIVIALLLIQAPAFAQESRFSISINSLTTNFNYGKSNSALNPYKKNFRGFQAGVSYQAGISSRFSLVPELYYATKGAVLKEGNPLTGGKTKWRINTIEMPVLARFHINRLYLNAGPYAAYNFGGRIKNYGTETIPATATKISFGKDLSDFRRWDLGIQAGAGYRFSNKSTDFILDARYGYGLVTISRVEDRYNRMLNISFVVSKPRKKKAKTNEAANYLPISFTACEILAKR